MAKALFVSKLEVAANTVISADVNDDKIIPFIKIAQDTHVFNYLGQKLYEKITDGIINSNLTADYLTLLNNYIKPMTIHWAAVEFIPFNGVTISNNGNFQHNSENSNIADNSRVDVLTEKSRQIAQSYTERFVDYMIINYAKYPEYYLASQIGQRPAMMNVMVGNWYLGDYHPQKIQNDSGDLTNAQ